MLKVSSNPCLFGLFPSAGGFVALQLMALFNW